MQTLESDSNDHQPSTYFVYRSTSGVPAGFGDRIVGLVSAILLAKWSNRRLMIDWQFPYLGENYVNQFPFEASSVAGMTTEVLESIDTRLKYKDRIESTPTISSAQVVFLECNQEIAKFHEMAQHNFLKQSMVVYSELFTKYLKYTGQSPAAAPTIDLSPKKKQIGIQIRTGDTHMNVGPHEFFSKQELVNNVLTQCADFIRTSAWSPQNYEIFFTSDYDSVREFSLLLPEYCICHNGGNVIHLGRQNTSNGTLKTLTDLRQLQQSDVFLISWHSNFGRMAALSAPVERPVYLIIQSPEGRMSSIRGPVKDKECLTRKISVSSAWDNFNE